MKLFIVQKIKAQRLKSLGARDGPPRKCIFSPEGFEEESENALVRRRRGRRFDEFEDLAPNIFKISFVNLIVRKLLKLSER